MFKRILSVIACVFILINMFSICVFADSVIENGVENGKYKYFTLSVPIYDSNGNAVGSKEFAEAYVPDGAHTTNYDELFDASGQLVMKNIAFDNNKEWSCTYAYMIGLINSSTTTSHAIISVEEEMQHLNYFMEQKWVDSSNNYEWRSYLLASQMLGAYCVYSYDTRGADAITDDSRDPRTEVEFYEWFNEMNKRFVSEWFEYYNSKYEETNGTAFYYYPFNANVGYDFIVGERQAKPIGTINILYRKAKYFAYNLHIEGGSYVGTNDSVIDFVFNLISSVRVDLWAAWLPSQVAGTFYTFYSMMLAVLTVLLGLKLVRG